MFQLEEDEALQDGSSECWEGDAQDKCKRETMLIIDGHRKKEEIKRERERDKLEKIKNKRGFPLQ